jgi:hypothetical protein
MTELPKELISATKRTSAGYPNESSSHKPQSSQFKECMQSVKEREEEESSNSDEQCDNALAAYSSPFSLVSPSIGAETHSQPSIEAVSPLNRSSLEMEALFEKMASTMIVMTSTEESETTLYLDSPKFSSSAFFGTRITVKEFSTAPKIFNIEIASHQAALNLLATHKDALLAAFESHKLPFAIHRLDTELHGIEEHASHHSDKEDGQDRKQDESS